MRSLNRAICTSGEPVSFAWVRYCSINPDLASLNSLPLAPCTQHSFVFILAVKSLSQRLRGGKYLSALPVARVPRAPEAGLSLARADERKEFIARLLVLAENA